MSRPRDAVLDEFLPHLARMNPAFDRSWVTDAWTFAAPFAQPIVTVDYRHHIPPFATPIPNLWVASMFQVYPHDRGQNYSIALAERARRSKHADPRSVRPLVNGGRSGRVELVEAGRLDLDVRHARRASPPDRTDGVVDERAAASPASFSPPPTRITTSAKMSSAFMARAIMRRWSSDPTGGAIGQCGVVVLVVGGRDPRRSLPRWASADGAGVVSVAGDRQRLTRHWSLDGGPVRAFARWR